MKNPRLQLDWNLNQLRIVTGKDQRTIQKRLAGTLPVESGGKIKFYRAPDCFRKIFQGDKPRQGAAERLAIANANRAERKDSMEEGSIIPLMAAVDAWEDLTTLFRQRALNIGNNLESRGKLNHEQRVVLDAEVKDALAELAKEISYKADKIEKEER